MAFDHKELRTAFGAFMTGVTVVTTVNESGENIGFTANSFTSLSIDPPLVLVCPSKQISCFDIFNTCTHFAINVLSENQQHVSNTFASETGDRFAEIDWIKDSNGIPLIEGATAHFSCSNYKVVDGGDHIILIGEVTAFDSNDQLGLGYASGGYFSLGMERRAEELSQNKSVFVGAIVQYDDKVLLLKTEHGYCLPGIESKSGEGSQESVNKHLQAIGIQAELGPVFSIYENDDDNYFSTYYRAQSSVENNSDQCELIAVDALSTIEYANNGVKSMMLRYMTEKQNGVFRVYVGNEQLGDIH